MSPVNYPDVEKAVNRPATECNSVGAVCKGILCKQDIKISYAAA